LALDAGGWLMPQLVYLVLIVQEAGWALVLVWMGRENLTSTEVKTPDCPAHSKSIYWLFLPGHL